MSNGNVATTASTNNTMNQQLYDNMTEIINMLNKPGNKKEIKSVISGINKINDEIPILQTSINARNSAIQEFYQKYKNNKTIEKIATDMQQKYNNSIKNNVSVDELNKILTDTENWFEATRKAAEEADAEEAAKKAAEEKEAAEKAEAARKAAEEKAQQTKAEEDKKAAIKAAEEAEAARIAAEEAARIASEKAKKAAEEEAYQKFKQEALKVLIPKPITVSVPVLQEPVDHYEEFKCKALQHMQQILNNSLLGNIESNSYYNEFKLKAVQIINKVAFDVEAQKVKEAAEVEKAAAEAEKIKAIAAAETAAAELANLNKSSQEQINILNYSEFKTKALEKMRDIQLAQDVINNNYQTFVLKATAVLNNAATQGLNNKITDNANAISAASADKNKLEQDFAYKEFKHKAELVLIRSLTGDISKQLAEKQTIIATDNYTEFKLKAQMVLTQALLNNQQQKYMEQQQQGFYEQFKSKALNVLTSIVAQQSLYNEFKEKALNALKKISTNSKIQSLTNDIYYEEFKQKALASLTYSNPELGSTEWVSTM
jgi:hypothetical protein